MKVEKLIKDDLETLTMWREAVTNKVGKPKSNGDNHYNVMIGKQGNRKSYTLSRLKREDPALFQRVVTNKVGRPKSNSDIITISNLPVLPSPMDQPTSDTPERGTSKGYVLSRLKREDPALFQRVCSGEPDGVGTSRDVVERLLSDHPIVLAAWRGVAVEKLAAHGGDHKSESSKSTLPGNVDRRGNAATYLIGRLKRDHPAMAERVTAGKITAKAAAREVGIIKTHSETERGP